jgi:hypothetical protein
MAVYELMPMESRQVDRGPVRRQRRARRPTGVATHRPTDSSLSLLTDSFSRQSPGGSGSSTAVDSSTVAVRYGASTGRALGDRAALREPIGELRALREFPAALAPVVPLRATPLSLLDSRSFLLDSRAASPLAAGSNVRCGSPRRARLTPRGRRLTRTVVVFVALLVAVTIAVLSHVGSDQMSAVGLRTSTSHVVVQPGQTLWAIASAALPQLDPRDAVQQVSDLNGLRAGQAVVPGQDLRLPAAS